MLVDFQMATRPPRRLSVNPAFVATVEEGHDKATCDIITSVGHTFVVRGAYEDVRTKLNIEEPAPNGKDGKPRK